ncbi:MAG: hypothetical protein ABW250_24180 [Pyrinomonadaceae bacterium]
MFESLQTREAWPLVVLRRGVAALLAVCAVIAVASGYRAYYQVRSLELRLSEPALREGSVVRVDVSGSGRTMIDVRVELVQGGHSETLAERRLPGNDWAAFDPRPDDASYSVAVTPEQLARFQSGAAKVRATATGRPQWMRLPPPTVRETEVEIVRD